LLELLQVSVICRAGELEEARGQEKRVSRICTLGQSRHVLDEWKKCWVLDKGKELTNCPS
jgi:hypothetical protein